jgi:hypothetical protein
MPDEITETNYPPGTLYDPESPEERFEPGSEAAETVVDEETAGQFGTIDDAGSPTDNPDEGSGPEGAPAQQGAEPDKGSGRG